MEQRRGQHRRRRTPRLRLGALPSGAIAGLQRGTTRLLWLSLGAALVVFVGLFVWQTFRIRAVRAEYDATNSRIVALRDRNAKLQNQLDYLKGPGYALYVEKVAREGLGMARPGETVVEVVDPSPQPNAPQSAAKAPAPLPDAAPPPKPEPTWQHWVDLFFNT